MGSLLLLVEPCNLRLLPLVISDVLSDLTLPLQRLPVAVGTLPQGIGEVLLPLEDRHEPLLTPLPVKKKNSYNIGHIYRAGRHNLRRYRGIQQILEIYR